jgi:phage terminase large subunit-like protein
MNARSRGKEAADRAVKFVRSLMHGKGKWYGINFNLMPWQEKIIRDIFGTLNPDGTRQYRTAYIEIPRKNGKTELGAAIALYLLFGDAEKGGEIYSAAGDTDQASLVYSAATPMVRQSPVLRANSRIIDSRKRIIYPRYGSFYRVISAEAKTKHGFNASGVIFDELHVQPNRDLWDALTTSGGTRTQPLTVAITTAGYDRHSICYEQHDYAERIIKGVIEDPTFYPVIYAAGEGDDWEDERTWQKANPALGNFRSLEEMRVLYRKAKNVAALQNTFKRLYLNIWTSQETRWIDIAKWDKTAGKVDKDDLKGKQCYAALDLSSTTDITALVLLFPVEDKYKVLPFFFIPEDNIEERVRKDGVPYDVWIREGFITATPGNVIDYQFIEDRIDSLSRTYQVKEMAYDPWNATMLTQRLADKGMTMVEVRQGFGSLSAPTKQLEALILSKKIYHGGNPVLRWMADNVMVKQDAAGNLKPDKEKSKEKIDGIVALIMAVDRATRSKTAKPSVYEDRGVITI